MAVATFTLSLTETRQFRRLVEFVAEIEHLSRVNADEELQELVAKLRDDLLGEV